MKNELKELTRQGDLGILESALRTLCFEFGSVSRLDIRPVTDCGKRLAICLLRLDSSQCEQDLTARFGARRFGADLCVVVDITMPDRAQT